MVFNALVGVASIAVLAVDLAPMLTGSKTPDPQKQTQITLVTGTGPGGDGTVPDVYIKTNDGNQLAHLRDEDGHLDNESFRTFTVDNVVYTDIENSNINAVRSGQPGTQRQLRCTIATY
jgi:hypothetical protein